MKVKAGIELLEEMVGSGEIAEKGSPVTYNIRVFLNKGDEVPINDAQITAGMPIDRIRTTGTLRFVDHQVTLGKRQVIAGIEHSLMGMRAGGYRKVRVSPHLAYRDEGIPDLVPANAVLVIEVWLRHVDA